MPIKFFHRQNSDSYSYLILKIGGSKCPFSGVPCGLKDLPENGHFGLDENLS